MVKCCVRGCKSAKENSPFKGQSFYRIPRSSTQHLAWTQVLGRKECLTSNTKYRVVCSDHFLDDKFDRTGQTIRLRDGSVPTKVTSQQIPTGKELFSIHNDHNYSCTATENRTNKVDVLGPSEQPEQTSNVKNIIDYVEYEHNYSVKYPHQYENMQTTGSSSTVQSSKFVKTTLTLCEQFDIVKTHRNLNIPDVNDSNIQQQTKSEVNTYEMETDKYTVGSETKVALPSSLTSDLNNYQVKSEKCNFVCELSALEKYKCSLCDFENQLKLAIDRHLHLIHQRSGCQDLKFQLKCYECRVCKFKTNSVLVFARHDCSVYGPLKNKSLGELVMQEKKLQHNSQHKISNSNGFNKQQTESHVTMWYKCAKCDYTTNLRNNLVRHNACKHTNPKKINWFKCEYCQYKAKEKCTLKRHIFAKHSISEIMQCPKCKMCQSKTKYVRSFETHFVSQRNPRKVKWFGCKLCSYKFKCRQYLEEHVLTKHTDPTVVKCFQCKQCPF